MPNAHLCLERAAVVACVLALLTGGTAAAQSPARAVLRAVAVTEPPTIDGVLDDVAWSGDAQPTGEWLSYNPLHGDRIPQQTRVWIAQTSYHLMVNPSGIQLDLLNTISGNEDPSPDYVWDSAGRTNDRGYSVEIRVPLQTLRFRGGKNVSMGVLFWRRVSRSGVSVSWPPLQPGKWVFENHASLNFDSLPAIKTRELIPSATFASSQERERPERW
jgi:hypothetical protein